MRVYRFRVDLQSFFAQVFDDVLRDVHRLILGEVALNQNLDSQTFDESHEELLEVHVIDAVNVFKAVEVKLVLGFDEVETKLSEKVRKFN